ncbi:DUF3631 domain-containing protein [Micromonospora arida]
MILNEVEDSIRKYVILTEDQYVAVTLWAAATHGIDWWEHASRLAILSPEKGCGKTRLLDVLQPLSFQPMAAGDMSAAAIFRLLAQQSQTIFHDEVDTIFDPKLRNQHIDLIAFYNNGYSPNKPVWRCVGPKSTPTAFPTFAMAALASKTHDLPDTIQDRAVVIRMRKRASGETVSDFRIRRDIPVLEQQGMRLGKWVEAHEDKLAAAEPTSKLIDRAADVWESLLAIADVAGGDWPERARLAARGLARAEHGHDTVTPGTRLLRDIERLWPTDDDFLPTWELLKLVTGDNQSDWGRHDYGKPLTESQMAALLRPFGIRPKQKKVMGKPIRGYLRSLLEDAWERYR